MGNYPVDLGINYFSITVNYQKLEILKEMNTQC